MTEAFNRAHLDADYPEDSSAAPWQASKEGLDATQTDADAAAKRFWQRSSWYRRANIHAESLAGQPLIDDVSTQGAVLTSELTDAAAAGETMPSAGSRTSGSRPSPRCRSSGSTSRTRCSAATRATTQLLGSPRGDDPAPVDLLRREIARLEPQRVYLPLGIGGHVDHQLTRDAGLALLAEGRRWVMPGPDYTGQVVLYEDFPYAWWEDFARIEDMPPGSFDGLPTGSRCSPSTPTSATRSSARSGRIALYESQIDGCSTARRPWPRPCAATRRAPPTSAECPAASPSATGSRRRPDRMTYPALDQPQAEPGGAYA